jgi:hypothetical protein
MLYWVLAALAVVGALAIVWGLCTCWPAAGFSSEVRAGVDPLKTSPARKWRAMGRIEQTLLVGDAAPTDLRPSPATTPYHIKVTNVSIYDKGPGYYMILTSGPPGAESAAFYAPDTAPRQCLWPLVRRDNACS